MGVSYFFDTYAIIELLLKNQAYAKYNDYPLVTTALNKIEAGWWALTRYDKKFAEILVESLSNVVEIGDDVIVEAMIFKQKHKKRKLSAADVIGYTFARKNNLLFLTGDMQFKDMPGVKYVK